ncbi:MAG: hypothetical protein KME04_16440 [Pleurocapsa minor GSE-CHR-MK-17-07R]|jgi:hypothetical protein|nr:hypothetical protein [Pleurocapsa minor GSE-CHR-MK 17-07R]
MLDSPIFQVIIGLIFIFSLLSIIVTQVNTTVVNALNLRAKSLKSGIYDLLTDPETRAKFMAHPLVRLVPSVIHPNEKMSAQAADDVALESPTGVTWIDEDMFSETLVDILSSYANDRLFRSLFETIDTVLTGAERAQVTEMVRRFQAGGVGITELTNIISGLHSPDDRMALMAQLERVNEMRRELHVNNEESKLIPLLAGIQNIADPSMKKALETLLASARTLDEARAKLETWFNARMSLVTDLYKRNITRISYIIGAIIVLLLNVDTLYMARTLWNDPALRETVSAAAEASVNSGALAEQLQQSQAALDEALARMEALQSGQPDTLPEAVPQVDASAQAAVSEDSSQFSSTVDDLLALRLPLGWSFTPVESGCPSPQADFTACDDGRNLWLAIPGNNSGWLGFIIGKLAGWLLTIIAIGQGAPFWFDLLNRIARGPRS